MSDTIAAIATPLVKSAIGIVRISGEDAIAVAERVFTPFRGGKLSDVGTGRLVYGTLRAPGGEMLDLCLATISRAPASYTGEDTAELQCHGSPAVLRAALEAVFAAGARQALAGEFTRRAFLNGKLDLIEAEAVADLIDAPTAESAVNAASQLSGAVSRRVEEVYSELLQLQSHFGALLDYPDEDIEPFELGKCRETLMDCEAKLQRLLDSFSRGRVLRDGLPAALLGKPNVGKSSLLNALLGYDRAIVTAEPGTTRDTIAERVIVGGVLLRLTDTAGLRETANIAEHEGVERSIAAAKESTLALAVFDGSAPFSEADSATVTAAGSAQRSIAVVNKSDLPLAFDTSALPNTFDATVFVSAKTGEGLAELESAVRALFPAPDVPAGEILTNTRHFDAIARAEAAIARATAALDAGMTTDIILTDAEDALASLASLTGRHVRDDIVDEIFSRFCVGK